MQGEFQTNLFDTCMAFREECSRLRKQELKGDGALIFDEVKVSCGTPVNYHQLIGLAMTHGNQESCVIE